MSTITAVGIDLAKNVFQVCAVNQAEKVQFNVKVKRSQLVKKISTLPKAKIFMEACGGSHYWAQRFSDMGHEVKLIAGQHVKKFVKGNKNDAIDAEAIVVCGLRPSTRFVPIKTSNQLEQQAIHRIRTRLVRDRTALCNEIRAFLYEHGIIIEKSRRKLETSLKDLISSRRIEGTLLHLIADLFNEYLEKCELIQQYEAKIENSFEEDERKQKLLKIPGIGPITASAILVEFQDLREFTKGRHLAAYLGLVPKHSGSGGRNKTHSLSKRGDAYIRTLLIHGARSAIRFTKSRNDKVSRWCEGLKERMCMNKAAVALANKNARMIWAILSSNEDYLPEKVA